MRKLFSIVGIGAVLLLVVLILTKPQICINSVISGLILCGRVIIPALYPFTFCVLFILKSGLLQKLKIPESVCIFLLSLVGGYPLGAKMLNDSKIAPKTATIMLNFCVNAGPAFIILTVGSGVFSSTKIGVLLYLSHLLPSVIMALTFRKKLKFKSEIKSQNELNIIDNFVLSASDSASTLINICSFVILFSVVCEYIKLCPVLSPIIPFLEVSNGIATSRNIYLLSFLLGFGGICIWLQVFSLSKRYKPNYFGFILCRLFHGGLSCGITFLLLKIFNIPISTLSNGKIFTYSTFSQNIGVGISLTITSIILIISLCNKNFAGNVLEDMV